MKEENIASLTPLMRHNWPKASLKEMAAFVMEENGHGNKQYENVSFRGGLFLCMKIIIFHFPIKNFRFNSLVFISKLVDEPPKRVRTSTLSFGACHLLAKRRTTFAIGVTTVRQSTLSYRTGGDSARESNLLTGAALALVSQSEVSRQDNLENTQTHIVTFIPTYTPKHIWMINMTTRTTVQTVA